MNIGVNQKSMAPPVPPAKTGGKKEVKLNAMPWFHGKVNNAIYSFYVK